MIEYENLKRLNEPLFSEFERVFAATLESGWYILGSRVEVFEKDFAQYCGTKHCIGVANGLDALSLALHSFGFQPGDEVLVPSNTYIATILAVLQNRLVPVPVEPDILTYNMNPADATRRITNRTKAILPVHLYGKLANMDALSQLALDNGLKVVEDCAQAHGAHYKGRKAGNWGDFGAFSFYPTKNLGALGDSGALTCNSDDEANIIRMIRNYGSKVKYYNEVAGFNSRLDELQAAFLSVKLKVLDEINAHKRALAEIYFAGCKRDFILPIRDVNYFDVYHIFNVRHEKRDALRAHLLKRGIKTEIHYPIAPRNQLALKGIWSDYALPLAEDIHKTTLSLPISWFHTAEDIEKVVKALNDF